MCKLGTMMNRMNRSTLLALVLPVLALSSVGSVACGPDATSAPKTPATAPAPAGSAPAPEAQKSDPAVNVSSDIRELCKIEVSKATPKFDFDSSDLSSAEREVLDQVAKCLTTGPLKGRSIQLVGRADPRGEQEYNMTLGHQRAGSVKIYLTKLGVAETQVNETSRGELDASGTDADGWRRDRRVDVNLLPQK